jgi:hypothetical protein
MSHFAFLQDNGSDEVAELLAAKMGYESLGEVPSLLFEFIFVLKTLNE